MFRFQDFSLIASRVHLAIDIWNSDPCRGSHELVNALGFACSLRSGKRVTKLVVVDSVLGSTHIEFSHLVSTVYFLVSLDADFGIGGIDTGVARTCRGRHRGARHDHGVGRRGAQHADQDFPLTLPFLLA